MPAAWTLRLRYTETIQCHIEIRALLTKMIDKSKICVQMNLTGAIVRGQAFFGQGSGSIVLDNVRCTGSEPTLLTCRSNPIGINNCDHSEDVGVICQPRPPSEYDSVRKSSY